MTKNEMMFLAGIAAVALFLARNRIAEAAYRLGSGRAGKKKTTGPLNGGLYDSSLRTAYTIHPDLSRGIR